MSKPKTQNVSFHMARELRRHMTPEARRFALLEWYRYMFPYIPFETGILASTMVLSEDENKKIQLSPEQAMLIGEERIQENIHFHVPYASRQYDGENFHFNTDLHPLAQAKWGEVAADLHGEQIAQAVKKFVKRSENQ